MFGYVHCQYIYKLFAICDMLLATKIPNTQNLTTLFHHPNFESKSLFLAIAKTVPYLWQLSKSASAMYKCPLCNHVLYGSLHP